MVVDSSSHLDNRASFTLCDSADRCTEWVVPPFCFVRFTLLHRKSKHCRVESVGITCEIVLANEVLRAGDDGS